MMLAITPQMKILVAIEPADFRMGIDGLVRLCKDALCEDPFTGTVFCFRNRWNTAIRVLVYDGQGIFFGRCLSRMRHRHSLPETAQRRGADHWASSIQEWDRIWDHYSPKWDRKWDPRRTT